VGIEVGLFARHAEQMAAEALVDTRVVAVNGARQVGKSTLAGLLPVLVEEPERPKAQRIAVVHV
jgi:predicted AAA+ superfamily ATPase